MARRGNKVQNKVRRLAIESKSFDLIAEDDKFVIVEREKGRLLRIEFPMDIWTR